MNQQEQIKIVTDLIESVMADLVADIEAGKVPESWDGNELRWLIAERFGRQTYKWPSKTRRAIFNNTVLVNDL